MSEQVYLRDLSSGRIHIGIRRGSRYFTDESDNLDQAGKVERLQTLPTDARESDFCLRCFPEPPPDLSSAE